MKTPKRTITCKDCHFYIPHSHRCSLLGTKNIERKTEICEMVYNNYTAQTRWKRKNKVRQLKNTIAQMKQQVKFQAERAQGLREMYIEANKRVVFLEMKLALDIRHNKNR